LKNFGVTRSKTRGVLARTVPQTSDAKNRIARTMTLAPVIASGAKQSSAAGSAALDRFVASLLAMTNRNLENRHAEEKFA
jgi:hypothetical protein